MSLVFDFGQGLRCGLSIRHCRCHWIMAAWFVFLHFFLVPLCWYAVSERQMLLFFAGGFSWSRQTSLLKGFSIIYSFYYSPMSMLFQNKNNLVLSKTRRKMSSMSSMAKLKDSRSCFITRWRVFYQCVQLVQGEIMLISITITQILALYDQQVWLIDIQTQTYETVYWYCYETNLSI